MTLAEISYTAAYRALDKQEALLAEVRARTAVLLAAASLAPSFLGGPALDRPRPTWLVAVALAAFLLSVGAAIYALTPKRGFTFAVSGTRVFERLFAIREDVAEVHRRLAYSLQRHWDENERLMRNTIRAYRVAAATLVVEIGSLAALVSGRVLA